MAWSTPVIDRTNDDVLYLAELRDKILDTGFASLTDDEERFWFYGNDDYLCDANGDFLFGNTDALLCATGIIKGAVNIADLQRIEDNAKYLQEILLVAGYGTEGISHKFKWIMEDIPYLVEHITRIRYNVTELVESFLSTGIAPTLDTSAFLNYEDINDLEISLKLIYDYFQLMVANYIPCGTVVCGEVY